MLPSRATLVYEMRHTKADLRAQGPWVWPSANYRSRPKDRLVEPSAA